MEDILKQILAEIKDMKIDMKDMKYDIHGMKSEIKDLKSDVQGMKSDIKDLESDVQGLKSQVAENTQILKSLEHSSEVNKSEHDKMINDIAHMNGTIEAMKKDLSQVEIVTAGNWADIAKLKAVK